MVLNERVDTLGTPSQPFSQKSPPDLRLLHYNDVYHIE